MLPDRFPRALPAFPECRIHPRAGGWTGGRCAERGASPRRGIEARGLSVIAAERLYSWLGGKICWFLAILFFMFFF